MSSNQAGPEADVGAVPGQDDVSKSVTKANADLKQKPLKHTPHDFTIKRNEQREIEALALAEALGDWCTKLLGKPVRGAEGFFEDTANGVIPCLILRKLGVACEAPRDPPRNEFDAKENRQKFQRACIKARFSSVPSFDREPATGLIPTLIECAAIDQAQRKKNHTPDIVPDAITKRTGEAAQSEAVRDAVEGRMVGGASSNDAADVKSGEVIATDAKAVGTTALKAVVASSPSVERRGKDAASAAHVSAIATQGKDSKIEHADAARARRGRTASEIPQQEKDQIFSNALAAIGALLLLIILLYWLSG